MKAVAAFVLGYIHGRWPDVFKEYVAHAVVTDKDFFKEAA